ncbi:glycosyltransferase family 4 protein [Falsiroseomonas bella]|uniref:glycosyltransferase family 4 protein n=1 Tax=Falsiroseomonas bella TaxID=2184016 RepID=UPI001304FA15|nr:glycosyltransferase family 4 protein [Falsiroseomonas bella]
MRPEPPRCLLVCHTFPPLIGGSAGVYAALARHAGGAIAVLTSARDAATGREWPGWRALDAAAPYPIRRLPLVRPPLAAAAPRNRLLRQVAWGAAALRLALVVAREAQRHRADAVCICDDETVGWLVPFVRRVLRRRALIYCHGDDLVQADAAARAKRRRWFDEADCIIAAGRFPAARLAGAYGVPPARIGVVPNGVDLDRFRPLPPDPARRAALGLAERRVILAPSRLVPRKGVDRLIAAMPAIRAAHPEAILLVAGDGPQRAELEALAQACGGAESVRFAGAIPAEDMPALYALADFVALPNRAEPGESDGTPLVFLEANACGRPVIGGRAGGTAEAVTDGRNGLLVDGEDSGAIAAAALRLLDDPAFAARLAAGGLEAARAAGWAARTAQFLALCRPGMAPQASLG